MNQSKASSAQLVFNRWELVVKICSYLPWHDVCKLRNLNMQTRYACKHCIKEISNPDGYGINASDIYDLFDALGARGCQKLKKLDLRSSADLSNNIGPLLKFCENLEFFGFRKDHSGHDFYFNLIYNTDIKHFAVEPTRQEYFTDTDSVDIQLLLPNIQHLEMPSTLISDITLSEIADEQNTLRTLNLSHCKQISDIGITEILEKCPMLKNLNVQGTPTMDHCIRSVVSHKALRFLNATETRLTEENARYITKSFDYLKCKYEFLYNIQVKNEKSIDVITVEQRNAENARPIFDNDSDSELIFDEFVTDDEISLTSSVTSSVTSLNSALEELTASEYLTRLKHVANTPVSVPNVQAIRCWNNSEEFDGDIFDYDGVSTDSSEFDIEDDETERDVGWKQIDQVFKNIENLQKEFDFLVEKVNL